MFTWNNFIYPLEMTFSQKKSHLTLRAKLATFSFWVNNSSLKKSQKWLILASFWNPEFCCQIVLPDRTLLQGQKLVENAKIQMGLFGLFSNNVHFFAHKKNSKESLRIFQLFHRSNPKIKGFSIKVYICCVNW